MTTRERVKKYLDKYPEESIRAIAKRVGVAHTVVHYHITRLRLEGKVSLGKRKIKCHKCKGKGFIRKD